MTATAATAARFFIVDPEIDPCNAGPDGMSAAFERNSAGRVLQTRDLSKAREWRNRRNKGVDAGEPEFFILAIDTIAGTQKQVA